MPALRVGDVFDQLQAVLLRESADQVHIAGVRPVVHRHDRLRPRRKAALQISGVQAHDIRVHVGKYDGRAQFLRRKAARPVGFRGADDLVPGFDSHGVVGRLQRHRAVGGANGVFPFVPRGELLFKLLRDLVAAHPVAAQHVQHGGLVLLAENRPAEQLFRQVPYVHQRRAAAQRKLCHFFLPPVARLRAPAARVFQIHYSIARGKCKQKNGSSRKNV